jgi:hypothetical protein
LPVRRSKKQASNPKAPALNNPIQSFNILQDYAWFDFPFAKDVTQGNLYLVRYEAYLMR